MKNISILFLLCIVFFSCKGQDCSQLPLNYRSYKEAIRKVKNSTFQTKETANTSASSWITSAKYYSCDGQTGYFIYTTNRGYEYIHKDVPLYIWEGFKNASSKGSYYDANIKGRYRLLLN